MTGDPVWYRSSHNVMQHLRTLLLDPYHVILLKCMLETDQSRTAPDNQLHKVSQERPLWVWIIMQPTSQPILWISQGQFSHTPWWVVRCNNSRDYHRFKNRREGVIVYSKLTRPRQSIYIYIVRLPSENVYRIELNNPGMDRRDSSTRSWGQYMGYMLHPKKTCT